MKLNTIAYLAIVLLTLCDRAESDDFTLVKERAIAELMKPPVSLLNIEEMLEVFGFFLMVLIGVELLESIKAYLQEERVHAEVVFLGKAPSLRSAPLIIVPTWREAPCNPRTSSTSPSRIIPAQWRGVDS